MAGRLVRTKTFADSWHGQLTSSWGIADRLVMSISSVGSMSSIAVAQSMFGLAAQTASGITDSSGGSGSGGAAEAVQVALLHKTLDTERSMVNIVA